MSEHYQVTSRSYYFCCDWIRRSANLKWRSVECIQKLFVSRGSLPVVHFFAVVFFTCQILRRTPKEWPSSKTAWKETSMKPRHDLKKAQTSWPSAEGYETAGCKCRTCHTCYRPPLMRTPTAYAPPPWLRVYAYALLVSQAVTSHRPMRNPDHSSRINWLRHILTQPREPNWTRTAPRNIAKRVAFSEYVFSASLIRLCTSCHFDLGGSWHG